MSPVVLEVCVASAADALAAQAGGADRVELNCALEAGGLTPSAGLLAATLHAVNVPVIAMMRPRPAGFCYSEGEFNTLLGDIDVAVDHGAAGIAFGVLQADGTIDVARCRKVMDRARDVELVFHRAFDVTPDADTALDQLIELGVDRVVTSGQAITAMDGADTIARLRERAGRHIEILPGCGVTEHNAAAVLRRTGCRQVHGSFRKRLEDPSTQARQQLDFGGSGNGSGYSATDSGLVRAVRAAIDAV